MTAPPMSSGGEKGAQERSTKDKEEQNQRHRLETENAELKLKLTQVLKETHTLQAQQQAAFLDMAALLSASNQAAMAAAANPQEQADCFAHKWERSSMEAEGHRALCLDQK